jgi:hypothetical protein
MERKGLCVIGQKVEE